MINSLGLLALVVLVVILFVDKDDLYVSALELLADAVDDGLFAAVDVYKLDEEGSGSC